MPIKQSKVQGCSLAAVNGSPETNGNQRFAFIETRQSVTQSDKTDCIQGYRHADLVVFRLAETDPNANSYWLGSALGLNSCTLCFEFWMDGRPAGPSRYKVKQHLEAFLKEKEVLQKAGFQFTKRGTLTLPFTLDPVVVAKEFPDLKKSLEPM